MNNIKTHILFIRRKLLLFVKSFLVYSFQFYPLTTFHVLHFHFLFSPFSLSFIYPYLSNVQFLSFLPSLYHISFVTSFVSYLQLTQQRQLREFKYSET